MLRTLGETSSVRVEWQLVHELGTAEASPVRLSALQEALHITALQGSRQGCTTTPTEGQSDAWPKQQTQKPLCSLYRSQGKA